MGVRFPSVQSNTIANALPASNAETAVCITPPLTISLDFASIFLAWFLTVIPGATTTSLVVRIRRGSGVAGVSIGALAWVQTVTAGNQVAMSGVYFDTPGAVAGQQYSLTVVQTAATGAGTQLDLSLLAFAL